MRVVKIGGNELSEQGFLDLLGSSVAQMLAETGETVVIVHGGGRAIAGLQAQLGLETVKIDGLRVTNLASLGAAEMVLSGQSNKIVVKALLAAGVDALGISGVDGGLLRCRKKLYPTADLGYVGEIVTVRQDLLQAMANLGLTVVVSPISWGLDGLTYNVNADEAAAAIARACGASELAYVSNVAGVLRDDEVVRQLTATQAEVLIADGTINGGMIPKVRTAVEAVASGVAVARIVNLAGLQEGLGTVIMSSGKTSS